MIKAIRSKTALDEKKIYRFRLKGQNTDIEFDSSIRHFKDKFINTYIEARLKDAVSTLLVAIYDGSSWLILKDDCGRNAGFSPQYAPDTRLSLAGQILVMLYEYKKQKGLI